MRTLTAAFFLCVLAVACGDERTAPPPPPPGGGTGGIGGIPFGGGHHTTKDAGTADAGPDAGENLSGVFTLGECVDDTDFSTTSNTLFMPTDLQLTRGYAHWIGSCGDAVLEIGLSDGDCPEGDGHELIFQIDADAITNDTLFIPGGNQLVTERPDVPISVRYVRPSDLTPTGLWGTCTGVSGELLIETLDTTKDTILKADFVMNLANCTTTTLPTAFTVNGSFSLQLARGLNQVCP